MAGPASDRAGTWAVQSWGTSYSVPQTNVVLFRTPLRAAGGYAGSVQDNARTLELLREFIAALDRRLPQIERAGEAAIADDAAHLKAKAAERIAEIERLGSTPAPER